MKITVLFLGRTGAGAKYSYEMSKALLEEGAFLQVILPKNVENLQDWIFLKEKYHVHLEFISFYNSISSFILKAINFQFYKKIISLVNTFNPNCVYVPMGGLLLPPILYFIKKPVIYTLHDPVSHSGDKFAILNKVSKFQFKSVKKIILLNNFFVNYVSEHFKIKKKDIKVIPHAAFFNENITFRKEIFYKILFIGRIEKYKGIDLLLDAFELVKSDKNIKLTIAGKGNIEPYLSKPNKIKNITFINKWLSEDEIQNLISEHDFVVLPYLDATQSGVIPLIFGNGKTVIATNVGALAEQIPEGLGIVVTAKAKDISDAIIKFYELDINKIQQINQYAYDYALMNLTWKSSALKLKGIITEMLNEN